MRYLPNVLSVMRMVLVVPVVWALATRRYELALVLFAVAGVSDALDGGLAKSRGWSSRLGAFLDPAADKLLVLGSFTALAVDRQVPWWLIGLLFGRDIVIVSGAAAYRWRRGPFEIQPALTSQIATGLLIGVGLALVVQGMHPWLGSDGRTALVVLLAIALGISGLDYVFTWGARYLRERGAPLAERKSSLPEGSPDP